MSVVIMYRLYLYVCVWCFELLFECLCECVATKHFQMIERFRHMMIMIANITENVGVVQNQSHYLKALRTCCFLRYQVSTKHRPKEFRRTNEYQSALKISG